MRPSRNPDLIQAFASAIKARRLELGMTQEALAAEIELDRPFITLMESGVKQPSLSVLWRLAVGLQFSASELAALVDRRLVRIQNPPRNAQAKRAPQSRSK